MRKKIASGDLTVVTEMEMGIEIEMDIEMDMEMEMGMRNATCKFSHLKIPVASG